MNFKKIVLIVSAIYSPNLISMQECLKRLWGFSQPTKLSEKKLSDNSNAHDNRDIKDSYDEKCELEKIDRNNRLRMIYGSDVKDTNYDYDVERKKRLRNERLREIYDSNGVVEKNGGQIYSYGPTGKLNAIHDLDGNLISVVD